MPKFAANLTTLFPEAPFLERFALARSAGFTHVEYLMPYDFAPDELKARLDANGLRQILFNLPSGNWAAGERGVAAHPARMEEFRAGIITALEYAQALGVIQLNCLAGKKSPDFSDEEHWSTLVENVRYAARAFQPRGLTVLVEAINHFDVPGFFLNRTAQVVQLIGEVNEPNVRLQYDVYHAQREEGEIVATLRKHIARIGHIQIADNPGRHEPGTGEINFPFIFREIDAMGYQGWIGLEYLPVSGAKASFAWINEMGGKL